MNKTPKFPNIPGLTKQQLDELRKAAIQELDRSPRIAIIGETGVGKSTTLNAMFNAGLDTHHVTACTKEAIELEIDVSELNSGKGNIIIYDMPGLGEDMDHDKSHKKTYKKVLSNCDVAVWILDGGTRQFTSTQLALRDVVGVAMGDLNRLVIGINKIDLIKPGEWDDKYNLPSSDQEESIRIKINDVLQKVAKVCPLPLEKIVPYSAEKWYRLDDLFGAMLDACPKERAWVLYSRRNLAEFLQKVDPEIRRRINKSK